MLVRFMKNKEKPKTHNTCEIGVNIIAAVFIITTMMMMMREDD